jgi:hypothetical protein
LNQAAERAQQAAQEVTEQPDVSALILSDEEEDDYNAIIDQQEEENLKAY